MITLLLAIGYCVAIVSLSVASVRRWRRSRLSAVGLGAMALCLCAIPVLIFAWFVGWLNPVLAYPAKLKIDNFERHLYVGEKRADIEKQLGRSIAKPDRRDGYGLSGSDIDEGMTGRLREYFYIAESSFCVQMYRGLVIHYDAHDRVTRWERGGFGNGC